MFARIFVIIISISIARSAASQNGSTPLESTNAQSSSSEWSPVDCPRPCQCSSRYSERFQAQLRTIDCTGQGLVGFPARLPSDTQSLILRRNRIRNPFDTHVWLPELVNLDLSHNHVDSMESSSSKSSMAIEQPRKSLFDGVYNLRVLDLARNQLTNLDDGVFEGLFNLEELNLAENRIARIADHAFRGLFKLESLRLSENRLAYVQSNWFAHVRTLYDLQLDNNYLNVLQAQQFVVLSNLLTLNLARNKIFRLADAALDGLDRLENLNLRSNSLTVVNREALRRVRTTLKSLNLDRNPIRAITGDDFANLQAVKDLSLNGMPRLKIVERGAFKNLPELLMVEMHDNPCLAYVDAASFVNAPQITHLLLHNNNLTVLEREIVDSLPSLEEMSFYGNPLTCDCNMRWLHDLVRGDNAQGQRRAINFPEFDRLVCDSPTEHRFKLFNGLKSTDLGDRCIRMLDNLFDADSERKIGDEITYRCRAIGVPKPRLFWTAPEQSHEPIEAGAYHPRRVLYDGNTLVIRRIKPEDAGSYVCVAENDAGNVVASTRLRVADIQIRLNTLRIGSTTATLNWNGTDREEHVFQILIRRTAETRRQYAATVTPIMKSYTVYNLRPNTDYEACITLVDGDEVVVNISCTRFTTGQLESAFRRIERTGNVAVGAALGIVSCMLIVVCLAAVAFKRSRTVVDIHDRFRTTTSNGAMDEDVESGMMISERQHHRSIDNVSNVTFCSVDNLYHPLLSSSSKFNPSSIVDQSDKRYVVQAWNLVKVDS